MKNLVRLNIGAKLNLFALVAVILFALIIFGLIIPLVKHTMRLNHESKLSAIVDTAISQMVYYENCIRSYQWKTDDTLPRTREAAQQRVLNYLRPLRYEKDQHVFVMDGSARMVMHPIKPELQSIGMAHVKAPDGSRPFEQMAIEAQRGRAVFVRYTWLSKWSRSVYEPQTTYACFFYPWNWVVCSSLYTQEIDDAMRQLTHRAALCLLFGALAGWLILHGIAQLITQPIIALDQQVREVTQRMDSHAAEIITIRGNDEIGDLANAFRYTVEKLQAAMTRLKENEENLRITLNSIGDAVMATDTDGMVVRMNPVAEKLTGWCFDKARNKPLNEVFQVLDVQTHEPADNPIERVLATGETAAAVNHKLLLAHDGKEYHIADSGAPIRNDQGRTSGVVLVFRDVTKEHAMQEQLRHSQKMEAIGQLAGGVAHDFNNMLGGIMGATEILKRILPTQKNTDEFLDMIMDSAQRAAGLTEQLLTFSRKQPAFTSVIDVHDVIHATIFFLQNTLDRRITLNENLAAACSTVVGDPSQLQNALLNLGINAAHAMPQGGTLKIATRMVELDRPYCEASPFAIRPGPYLEVEVTDTGCGIAAEDLPRIFEPFYTTKGPGKGTGLGLTAVFGAIQQHQGAISVYSQLKEGTSFHILLPLANDRPVSLPVKPAEIHGASCILVVDDEPIMRVTAQNILQDLGYQVLLAVDGQQGLEKFEAQHEEIDLVIMDMIMPRMNGRDCFKAMKERDHNVRMILSSGFTPEQDLKEMLDQGLCDFIHKPYHREELSQVVARVLAQD